MSTSGSTVTTANAYYHGSLAAAGRTSSGFIASGTAATPTVTCTATT